MTTRLKMNEMAEIKPNTLITDKHGIEEAYMDNTILPGDDFYHYACNGWIKSHPLPPDYASYGVFDYMRENNKERLKELITTLHDNPESKIHGTIAQKISDIYALGMDSDRLNKEGAEPIMPYLEEIKTFKTAELASELGYLHSGLAGGAFFGSGVGPDPVMSDNNILHLGETGLGLGDRDYYLEDNEDNRRIMNAYEKYVKRLMELIGYNQIAQNRVWQNVIDLERKFAAAKMTREDRRDPNKLSNPMNKEEIKQRWGNFDWDTYFTSLSLSPTKINVTNPHYFDFLNELLTELSDEQLQDYLVFCTIEEPSGLLSDDFFEAAFELYGKVMSGTEVAQPRWKRVMAIPSSMLGEAVGKLYVEKYFPEENKTYMLNLVENLRQSLQLHIQNLSWMGQETKNKAISKLRKMSVKIGYPDKWKDYSAIEIDQQKSYFENVLNASKWYIRDNYNKLDKPVDKSEWHMTPQTINAYYSPTTNEICFPAGILQPPYFDPQADDAMNYGAIGVIIGHEMTHGFDDSGRQFDENGNLKNWWTESDAEAFNKLANKLVQQFDKVEVAPGVHANGKYTLGENIADQGGLRVALTAYRHSNKKDEEKKIGNFNQLQRFYLSYAQVWASSIRQEEILVRTKTDPHSLAENRVNITLRNIKPFYEAFNITEGMPMYIDENDRVIIW